MSKKWQKWHLNSCDDFFLLNRDKATDLSRFINKRIVINDRERA
jgi:hypothetical protein